jgi:hypothetical protein
MPTPQHEALHRIFTHDKTLIARTLRRVFDMDVEALVDVSILNTDYTAEPGGIPAPHGDSALLGEFLVEGQKERFIIIVESQTEEDPKISYRWPYYATFLHTKHKCQVMLVVITSKQKTAEWARKPIIIGPLGIPCVRTNAIVLGPDNTPAITTLDQARSDIAFAALAAMTQSRTQDFSAILEVLHTALSEIDEDTATALSEFTEAGLGDTPAREFWRKLMAKSVYPYPSQLRLQGREEGREEGRAEGEAKGRAEGEATGRAEGEATGQAKAIITVLEDRGIAMKDADRERILTCTETGMLGAWLRRSHRISAISELFA